MNLEERLPTETTFKIESSDGGVVLNDPISNPFGNNLLVFNTDFVSRNFQWDASSTKGIAYISEKKVDAKKELDEIVPIFLAAQQTTKAKERTKSTFDREIAEFKTRVARYIREVAASSTYTQSYDARKIQGHYSRTSFGTEKKLSEDKLKEYQQILAQREPLPIIAFSPSLPQGLADWFRLGRSLLTATVPNIAQKQFEVHLDALKWVEDGLNYHDAHSVTNCLLCGNQFSEERRIQLRNLFNKSWTEVFEKIKDAWLHGNMLKDDLKELRRKIPTEYEISTQERELFIKTKTDLEASISYFIDCVRSLVSGLEARHDKPTREIQLPDDLETFSLDERLTKYETIETLFTTIINRHNSVFANFATIQNDAFNKIEAHVLATNQSGWNLLQKQLLDTEAELAIAITKEKELSVRQTALRSALQDLNVGADKMNELVWAYLGHKELRLVAEDGGYKILRPSGKPATELSEGERTAFSFCYYLTQLAAEGRKLEDLVLVIDDPISSLDTSARTYAYSLMTRMTKKCAQVIVLTHNTSFMNMVKREFQKLQNRDPDREVTALLSLDCRSLSESSDRSTSLTKMHSLLVKYDSEYHYLFSLVRSAAESKATEYVFLLPNAIRKLLEMFATFCSPGQPNFAAALMEHHEAVKNKVDVRALERLIQIESHGTIEGLGTLPDLTLEQAIRAADAAISFIKVVSKDHYKKMCDACEV